jgi:hypothetical protein
VAILIRLVLYLVTFPPSSLPLSSLPIPLKAIATSFLGLFHRGIWSPSTKYHHINFFPSPSSLLLSTPPHTHCTYFTALISVINIWVDVQRGVSIMSTVSVLYFGLYNPFEYSLLPLYLPPPSFQQLSIHILMSSTFTSYGMWYYWCFMILFLSLFPWVS